MSASVPASGTREQRVAIIAGAQRGVVSRAQLLAAGISPSAIGRMLSRGLLHPEHSGIYLLGQATATPLARETAALLSIGPGAVLSHRSAGALWELPVKPASSVEVSMRGRHSSDRAGVSVHRTRTLAERDVRRRYGLPVTSPARTLLDLADHLRGRELERALDEALVRHIVRRSQIADVLARAQGRHGAPALRALLERETPTTRTRSDGEERFLALVRQAGLPHPEVNAPLGDFEVDFLWRDERLAVEIDGPGVHGTRAAFERDRRKTTALAALDIQTLRLSTDQVDDQPLPVIAAVARRLGRAAA